MKNQMNKKELELLVSENETTQDKSEIEKKLKENLTIDNIVKTASVLSDGNQLLVKIPKLIQETLNLKQKDKLKFILNGIESNNKKLEIEVIKYEIS